MAVWPYSTAQWARLRRTKLKSAPLCEPCQQAGRLVVASVVDHRLAINRGGPAFPTLDGLASMCPPCHSRKTNREDRGEYAKGCDASGLPTDPQHPFYAEGEGGLQSLARRAGDRRAKSNPELVERLKGRR